jgi:hypothetical protein
MRDEALSVLVKRSGCSTPAGAIARQRFPVADLNVATVNRYPPAAPTLPRHLLFRQRFHWPRH